MYIIFDKLSKKIAPHMTFLTPNQITLGRFFLFIPLSFLCFLQGTYLFSILGILLYGMFSLFDWVDGKVAKLRKMTSKKGEFLDTIIDRLGSRAVMLGMIIFVFITTQSVLAWIFGFLLLLGCSLDDYVKLTGKLCKNDLVIDAHNYSLKSLLIPEYFLVAGTFLNMLPLFLIITMVFINIKWVWRAIKWWKTS